MKKIKFKIVLFLLVTSICGLYAEKKVFTEGDFEYTVKNRQASIAEYTGQTRGAYGYVEYENLIIPEKLGGYKITSIGNYAFLDCYGLTSIKIPDSVTSIGEGVFLNCDTVILAIAEDSYTHEYALENDIDFVLE